MLRALLCMGVLMTAAPRATRAEETVPELRERWQTMSEEQREQLRERFAELEKLSPEQRQELRERATRLDKLARTLYRSLEEDTRAELDQLKPEKRRQLLREMAVAEAQEIAQRVLSRLPQADRVRLEAATPEDRTAFFLEFEARQAKRLDREIAEVMRQGDSLFTKRELTRLNGMQGSMRREIFLEVVKRRAVRRAEAGSLPVGLSAQRWRRMLDLEPAEFWHALERARRKHGGFDREGPDGRSAAGDGDSGDGSQAAALLMALQVHADPRERMGMADLESGERRLRMRQRQRERVMTVIRERSLVDQAASERLDQGTDDEFFSEVRRLISSFRPTPRRDGRGARHDDGR